LGGGCVDRGTDQTERIGAADVGPN
jgi:hypothetical protein